MISSPPTIQNMSNPRKASRDIKRRVGALTSTGACTGALSVLLIRETANVIDVNQSYFRVSVYHFSRDRSTFSQSPGRYRPTSAFQPEAFLLVISPCISTLDSCTRAWGHLPCVGW